MDRSTVYYGFYDMGLVLFGVGVMPGKLGVIPERIKDYVSLYPIHNPLLTVERQDDGTVIIIYEKNFRRLEKWLHKRLGGPSYIRRPLDSVGSRIWDMCDGSITVEEISAVADREFKEDISPAVARVSKFISMLQERNLVFLFKQPVASEAVKEFLEEQMQHAIGTQEDAGSNKGKRKEKSTGKKAARKNKSGRGNKKLEEGKEGET